MSESRTPNPEPASILAATSPSAQLAHSAVLLAAELRLAIEAGVAILQAAPDPLPSYAQATLETLSDALAASAA